MEDVHAMFFPHSSIIFPPFSSIFTHFLSQFDPLGGVDSSSTRECPGYATVLWQEFHLSATYSIIKHHHRVAPPPLSSTK